MALQVGTVDGLINIGPKITDVFVKAIAAFAEQGVEYAKNKGRNNSTFNLIYNDL